MHRNFELLSQLIRKTETLIQECEVDEDDPAAYDKTIDKLANCVDNRTFGFLWDALPCNTEEECEAGLKIRKRFDALYKKRDERMRELGYSPD